MLEAFDMAIRQCPKQSFCVGTMSTEAWFRSNFPYVHPLFLLFSPCRVPVVSWMVLRITKYKSFESLLNIGQIIWSRYRLSCLSKNTQNCMANIWPDINVGWMLSEMSDGGFRWNNLGAFPKGFLVVWTSTQKELWIDHKSFPLDSILQLKTLL